MGEVGIVRLAPFDAVDGEMTHGHLMPVADMFFLIGHDLHAQLSIRKMYDRHRAFLMDRGLRFLRFIEAMGDGNMPMPLFVDTHHFCTKKTTVRRGVFPLIDSDIVMNHLVQDRVLHQVFRQVNPYIDAQHKILISVPAEEALPLAYKRHFSQESFRMTELNRQGRQRPIKILPVVLLKSRLYVFYRRFHGTKLQQFFEICKKNRPEERFFLEEEADYPFANAWSYA